ncbi:MAG: DNA internalization-related competence protein ComEC/Rec2 [Pseudomonadota bacterium]
MLGLPPKRKVERMRLVVLAGLGLSASLWAQSDRALWLALCVAATFVFLSRHCRVDRQSAIHLLFLMMLLMRIALPGHGDRLHPMLEDTEVRVALRLDSLPRERGGDRFWTAEVLTSDLPRKVLFKAPRLAPIVAGQCWEYRVRLRALNGRHNPGGPDLDLWAQQHRIGAIADALTVIPDSACGEQILRWHVVRRIRASLVSAGVSDQSRGLLLALLTGERIDVPADVMTLLRRTGTAHLLAISGLHVMLFGGIIAWLARWTLSMRNGPLVDRIRFVAVAVSAGYVWLAGAGLPAQRAWVMLAIVCMALFVRRRIGLSTVWWLACLLALVDAPQRVVGASFVLSFGAVALLALQQTWTAATWSGHPSPVRSLSLAQCLLSFGLAPAVALWFGGWSFIGVLINLAVVPLFSVIIMPACLFMLALLPVSEPLAATGWQLIASGFDLLLAGLRWLVHRIGGDIMVPLASSVFAVGLSAGVAYAIIAKHWPGRGLLAIAAAGVLWHAPPATPYGCLDLVAFDVGHGTAVSFQSARQTGLYDSGPRWFSGGDAASDIILPAWRRVGITTLDIGIISHADLDHAGGWSTLQTFDPDTRWMDPDRQFGHRCQRGQQWVQDGLRFRVLWPEGDDLTELSDNNRSCVLQIDIGLLSVLLPGDIEREAEAALVRDERVRATLTLAPHHGSETSSTMPWLQAVQADEVWFSRGRGGRWRLPDAQVLARWQATRARIRDTALDGALHARLCRPDSWQSGAYLVHKRGSALW